MRERCSGPTAPDRFVRTAAWSLLLAAFAGLILIAFGEHYRHQLRPFVIRHCHFVAVTFLRKFGKAGEIGLRNGPDKLEQYASNRGRKGINAERFEAENSGKQYLINLGQQ